MSDVKVTVTFRHTQPTQALKHYAENKVDRIGAFCSHPLDAHVILSVDAKMRQSAEIELPPTGRRSSAKNSRMVSTRPSIWRSMR